MALSPLQKKRKEKKRKIPLTTVVDQSKASGALKRGEVPIWCSGAMPFIDLQAKCELWLEAKSAL